jgi:hypothetical protein
VRGDSRHRFAWPRCASPSRRPNAAYPRSRLDDATQLEDFGEALGFIKPLDPRWDLISGHILTPPEGRREFQPERIETRVDRGIAATVAHQAARRWRKLQSRCRNSSVIGWR